MKVELKVSVEKTQLETLEKLVGLLCASMNPGLAYSHPIESVEGLIAMLLQDAALVVTRRGSWEAAHMRQLLQGHGFEL